MPSSQPLVAQLQVLRHEKREPPCGSEHTRLHTANGSRPNVDSMNLGSHGHLSVRIPRVEHHTFCMRTAQHYAISENDMLETTILTSTNTTGTLTQDDLDQPGTTYSTYPVWFPAERIGDISIKTHPIGIPLKGLPNRKGSKGCKRATTWLCFFFGVPTHTHTHTHHMHRLSPCLRLSCR